MRNDIYGRTVVRSSTTATTETYTVTRVGAVLEFGFPIGTPLEKVYEVIESMPPGDDLGRAKARAVADADADTESRITAGFSFTVGSVEYLFSYDPTDQLNFAQAASAALLAKMNADATFIMPWRGWVGSTPTTLMLDGATLIALCQAGGSHKQTKLMAGWDRKAAIGAALTIAAVRAA